MSGLQFVKSKMEKNQNWCHKSLKRKLLFRLYPFPKMNDSIRSPKSQVRFPQKIPKIEALANR